MSKEEWELFFNSDNRVQFFRYKIEDRYYATKLEFLQEVQQETDYIQELEFIDKTVKYITLDACNKMWQSNITVNVYDFDVKSNKYIIKTLSIQYTQVVPRDKSTYSEVLSTETKGAYILKNVKRSVQAIKQFESYLTAQRTS